MKIIDNFLLEEDFKVLEKTISSGNFCWRKSTILNGSSFQPPKILNIQFCHRFVTTHCETVEDVTICKEKQSEDYCIVKPILDKIEYSELIRVKANLNVGELNPQPTGFHVDVGDGKNVQPGYTGIYYVNTCNGYTLFKDGTKVDSIANRMLIFDNQMKHSGVTCSDNKYRIVINFNWLP